MLVSFIACPQKACLTEARMTFQQDSIFIATCWKHLHANKTGNLFEEKICLDIVSALIFFPCPIFFVYKNGLLYSRLEEIKIIHSKCKHNTVQ